VPRRCRCVAARHPAAASWSASAYLGLPGLAVAGAPADAVVNAEDPRLDRGLLDEPVAVAVRGVRVA
jgi:hypothetical protein